MYKRQVMAIDPAKKINIYGKGKYLLRKAFEGDYLPHHILYREKEMCIRDSPRSRLILYSETPFFRRRSEIRSLIKLSFISVL